MSEFQELIKNFDKIRDYMRQFFVYGFKVRSDFDRKSARTYDNERRRVESWLGEYTKAGYTGKGKHVYISVDGKSVAGNPLFAAWKSKSFTDNDLLLHFFILDLLMERKEGLSAGEVCDEISGVYGCVFDSQTVRLKLREYEGLGLLVSRKKGKALVYSLTDGFLEGPEDSCTRARLLEAVKFFQEAAPFGFVGSTLLDRAGEENCYFQWKHHFIVHTLEDGILADALSGIRERRRIAMEVKGSRSGRMSSLEGVPLKIFVSTRTGRRYLCVYQEIGRRFNNIRLDCIVRLRLLEVCTYYDEPAEKLARNLNRCWGVSFGSKNSRLEKVCIRLWIDEEREPYIISRLTREGRGGEVLRIRENEFLYSGAFFDVNEMLSWVKSFTGRILDIQCSSQAAEDKITVDWERMYRMYCSRDSIRPSAEADKDGDC